MPIEYETKLTLIAPLSPQLGDVDTEGQIIADYFPPGDGDYFGVRFRATAEVLATPEPARATIVGPAWAALSGQAARAELTVKGPTADPNARREQPHPIPAVVLHMFPACVKQRFRVRAVSVGPEVVPVPPQVAATLDVVINAFVRPVLELEGPAELVDLLHARILADGGRWVQGGPRYRKLAWVMPPTEDTLARVSRAVADQRAALRGEPVAEDHYPWLRSGPLPDYYGPAAGGPSAG